MRNYYRHFLSGGWESEWLIWLANVNTSSRCWKSDGNLRLRDSLCPANASIEQPQVHLLWIQLWWQTDTMEMENYLCLFMGFSGCSVGKESACNVRDPHSVPGWGRSPGEGNGYTVQNSCLENSMEEEPGGLQYSGQQRVGHKRMTNT